MITPTKYTQSLDFEIPPDPNPGYILFFMKYLRMSLYTPISIKRGGKTAVFYCGEGPLKKVACVGWLGIQFIYNIWGIALSPLAGKGDPTPIKALYRFTYISYALFQLVTARLMLVGFRQVAGILNEGSTIFNGMRSINGKIDSASASKLKATQLSQLILPVLMLLQAVSTSSSLVIFGYLNPTGSEQKQWVKRLINMTTLFFCPMQELWCEQFAKETGEPLPLAYVWSVTWLAVSITSETSWQVCPYMMASWGIYFKRLFQLSVRQLEGASCNREMILAIQRYTKMTALLDKWNGIFGAFLFFTIINTITYGTISLGAMLAEGRRWTSAFSMATFLGFVPFVIMLYFMMEVNRMGSSVPDIIKKKCFTERDLGHGQGTNLTLDLLYGAAAVQYDALSNSVVSRGWASSPFPTILPLALLA